MAEQSSRDVVDQTLSGGEPSSSDVPASTNDKTSAGGDVVDTKQSVSTSNMQATSEQRPDEVTKSTLDSNGGKDTEGSGVVRGHEIGSEERGTICLNILQDSKQGTGLVASRALELNGLASASDGGDDTASLGGSESDTSRTDSRNHARTGSVKKSAFKPVSFTKFALPKAPGGPAPPKAPEKGIVIPTIYLPAISFSQRNISSVYFYDSFGNTST